MTMNDDTAQMIRGAGTDGVAFRSTFGSFATGVAVASCRADGEDGTAITINSVTSVSMNPALTLFCLEETSGTLASFLRAGHFALNFLAEDQQEISNRYARDHNPVEGDFDAPWQSGAPILKDALAVADCVLHDVHGGGDHRIIVGQVLESGWRETARPLLYFRGRYGNIGDAAS